MKKIAILIVIIIVALIGFIYFHSHGKTATYNNPLLSNQTNITTPMTITSPAFGPNQTLPVKYTCDGDGVNPPLQISGVPQGAQSLALMLDDPDAPGGTWHHWLVWNIDPGTTSIAENSVPPKAIVGQGSSGQNNFGAACPPKGSGAHRYMFKLFALDAKLPLLFSATADDLTQAMNGHILGQAELVGLYGRAN